MKFCTVSDVHIRELGDESCRLFTSFLKSKECLESDTIFLLGDIFDLVVGGHDGYYSTFQSIFDQIANLAKSKRVVFLEGNHDFHYSSLIKKINKIHNVKIEYYDQPLVIKSFEKTILLAHGDELEQSNISYQRYRKLIRSRFINLLANDVVTYNFVSNLGIYLSRKSRKRNVKNYGNESKRLEIKERFKKDIETYFLREGKDLNLLICGHSHEQEQVMIGDKMYVNNGYFPKTKQFVFFNGKEPKFISVP